MSRRNNRQQLVGSPSWLDAVADRVAERVIAKSASTPVPVSSQADPFFLMTEWRRRLLSQDESMTRPLEQHAWISAAMRQVAQNFVRGALKFSRGTKERHDIKVPSTDPCAMVWDRPNPHMSYGYFIEALATHVWDVGYVAILKQKRGGKRLTLAGDVPEELWPIRGTYLQPMFEDGPGTAPSAWRLRNDAGEITLAPWEILWVRTFNPSDPWKGLGRIQAALTGAQQDYTAEQFMTGFLGNDATPGGVFSLDMTTTPAQRQEVADSFESRHAGPSNVNRVMVLQKGMTFTPTTYSPKDMQYQELRAWNRDQVLAVMGVPKILVGQVEDYNRATASSARAAFLLYTIIPAAEFFATAITMDMQTTWVGCKDVWAEFDWSRCEELQEIQSDKVGAAQAFFNMGVPFNEVNARMRLGFKPTSTGDIGFLQYTVVPASVVASGETFPVKVENPNVEPEFDNSQPATSTPAGNLGISGNGDLGVAGPQQPTAQPMPSGDTGDLGVASSAGRAARDRLGIEVRSATLRWHVYVARVLLPIELAMAKTLRGLFWRMRLETLGNARAAFLPKRDIGDAVQVVERKEDKPRRRLSRSLVERILFADGEWRQQIGDAMAPHYEDAATRAIEFTGGQLPRGVSTILTTGDPKIIQFLAEKEIKVRDVTSTLRERLRRTLVDAEIEASTIAEAQSEVLSLVRDQFASASARSLAIARTESAEASNGVRFMEMEEQAANPDSRIKRHRWLTAGDVHVRLQHQAVANEVVPIGEPFSNGLRYPGEVGAPPEQVINCRCVPEPILEPVNQ